MDATSSGDEFDDEPMSTYMLEDIRYGSQYHPIVNRREARYKICDILKGETWVKVYTSYSKISLTRFHKHYQFWMNLSQKYLTSFQNLETYQK